MAVEQDFQLGPPLRKAGQQRFRNLFLSVFLAEAKFFVDQAQSGLRLAL